MADLYWDPFDRSLHVDPYDTWKRMRDEAPVYRNDRYDFYALSRFQDVLEASLDHDTFSSAHGITLDAISPEPRIGPNPMIMMDPPAHTAMRKLVNRTFTPRRVADLEPRIRSLCARFLDPLSDAGRFDYVRDFSMKLPVMVISSLLGFPEEDHDRLREWSDAQLHRDENDPNLSPDGQKAFESLLSYYLEQVQLRREVPRDDIVTDLLHAELVEPDGTSRHLHDGELMTFIAMINVAGNETVARLLGWAALVLARFPNERAKLAASPGLIPNAVEELLRYEAPSPVQGRFATRDVELHGCTIPAGSKVALLTGSAGRDEREYPAPDVFDVERSNVRHLSFGHSAHFCLGAALARLEACIALEETLARFPAWSVDEGSVEFVHTNSVRGPAAATIEIQRPRASVR